MRNASAKQVVEVVEKPKLTSINLKNHFYTLLLVLYYTL